MHEALPLGVAVVVGQSHYQPLHVPLGSHNLLMVGSTARHSPFTASLRKMSGKTKRVHERREAERGAKVLQPARPLHRTKPRARVPAGHFEAS